MPYKYEEVKPQLFTEEGQSSFLKIRDRANELLDISGSFIAGKVLIGDSWFALACLDRMIELGEIREVPQHTGLFAQHRVFVRAR